MSNYVECLSCCCRCRTDGPADLRRRHAQVGSSPSDPFALENLFPAGTVIIQLSPTETVLCTHVHAEDSWHSYIGHDHFREVTMVEDDTFLRQLDFLVKHRFLALTYRIHPAISTLFIRIYIIPYNLPNVQGKLRTRDETAIMHPARRYMAATLTRTVRDPCYWNATGVSEVPAPFFDNPIDHRSMAQIYSDLQSPQIDNDRDPGLDAVVLRVQASHVLPGMRSSLYPYQRHSVIAMLLKELHPKLLDDPLYVCLKTMDERDVFLKPSNMEVLSERPRVTQGRGGVLCEELGTGKTVMVLALVLSTLDQLPAPEESLLDDRPILTPLAFKYFPFSVHGSARRAFRMNHVPQAEIPTLRDYLLHHIRVNPENMNLRDYEEELTDRGLWKPLMLNTPFYHHYIVEPLERVRVSRKPSVPAPRHIYISAATLIIVPPNLLAQWDREIQKHCDSTLRVFVLHPHLNLPRAQILANNYDIILMNHLKFSAESLKNEINKLHSFKSCRCPDTFGIPACCCDSDESISPLLRIRWKRLVIDEGHNTGTKTSNLVSFAKLLSVERHWIVTGTPTTNLLGLDFGSNSANVFPSKMDTSGSEVGEEFPEVVDEADARKWTQYDREDLRKLGTMMMDFLRVPQFSADRKAFDHVVEPLMNVSGPLPGAITVLTQVMQSVMIRHRISDVECDVSLPPVCQETVLLDLDKYGLKSYNAIQTVIAVNAVDSERKDIDYLFHPKNTARLAQLMENMSQTLFWKTDENLFNVDEIIARRDKLVLTAEKRGVSKSDQELLCRALNHADQAAEDKGWRVMQSHEDALYRVKDLPEALLTSWSRVSSVPTGEYFIHPDRLLKLRDSITERPLSGLEQMVRVGHIVTQLDELQRLAQERTMLMRKGNGRDVDRDKLLVQDPHLSVSGKNARRNMTSKERLAAVQGRIDELTHTVDRQSEPLKPSSENLALPPKTHGHDEARAVVELSPAPVIPSHTVHHHEGIPDYTTTPSASAFDNAIGLDQAKAAAREAPSSTLPFRVPQALDFEHPLRRSPWASIKVGRSTSSKLNYILREVQQHGPKEKFLIFSSSPLTLSHVAEGLDLLRVKYLQFNTRIPQRVREQLVTTFETSETFRVFLMELKHGARGLNLVTASRVIFCEPVWRADVESQAIKRAHRIGQKRSITVKTLAIRGTAEEVMMARREALKGHNTKLPTITEEIGMRDYIQNPRFVNLAASSTPDLDFWLFPELHTPKQPAELHPFMDEADIGDSGESSDIQRSAQVSPGSFRRQAIQDRPETRLPRDGTSMRNRQVRFLDPVDAVHTLSPSPSPSKRRRVILRLPSQGTAHSQRRK